ncbi:MAG: nuclear transport factor 2 family protein, partial [Pseudomonadota bacterium]
MAYSNRWADFPDYILGITKEIWEDRGIATLHDYYSSDIVVRSPGSVVIGNEKVIGATMATLAEFPDRQLLGEDVIWSADDGEDPQNGALSSHRIISTATHARDGVYGKATGKTLRYRILADCHAVGQTIDDEWLIRDQGAIVRQLGWAPKDYAADLIAREGGVGAAVKPFTPEIDQVGTYTGRGNEHALGHKHSELLKSMMSGDMAAIGQTYDRA